MEDREKIMGRLEALLRLKTDRGATQAEMETAMAMATKIAFKHRINLDEIVPDAQGQTRVGADMVKRVFRTLNPDCHVFIVDILTKFCGVKTCSDHGGHTLSLVGLPMDVDFAIYAYSFLRVTFKKLWGLQKFEDSLTDKDRESFYHGLWEGLVSKMSSEKAAQEAEASGINCRAMVLVDQHALALQEKFLAEFPNARMKRHNARVLNAEVHAVGKEIGQSLKINKAIGGSNARL